MVNEVQREALYRLDLKREIVRNNPKISRESIRNFSTHDLEDLRWQQKIGK